MNKQTKLLDTDNRMVVIRGEEEWGEENEEGKGGQICGDGRKHDSGW